MKIFVSHAAADKELATKFVDLLQLGVGVLHDQLFYSSAKGTIPNGEFFVQNVITELNSADLVIVLLSKAYFRSHFCLAESGAALARKTAKQTDFFSLIIPPASFSDLDGILHGVQSGSILERPVLGELKERIQKTMTTSFPSAQKWDEKRDEFLILAHQIVSLYQLKEALPMITVNNYQWKHEPGSTEHKVYVNFKIRINLKNGLPTPSTSNLELGTPVPTALLRTSIRSSSNGDYKKGIQKHRHLLCRQVRFLGHGSVWLKASMRQNASNAAPPNKPARCISISRLVRI
jgi:hypothetical protein